MAIVICTEAEMFLDESDPVSVWKYPDYVVIIIFIIQIHHL